MMRKSLDYRQVFLFQAGLRIPNSSSKCSAWGRNFQWGVEPQVLPGVAIYQVFDLINLFFADITEVRTLWQEKSGNFSKIS